MSVMSFKSLKEESVLNTNQSEWPPSSCIHPYVQLHTTLLRPGARGWDIVNCLWYIMEIEQKDLDEERWGKQTILIEN